jgi:citronellol/citronellal dehydrogenase
MAALKGRTLFITGASRGIGLAIGLRAAQDGANVAVAAKTTEPHPKLPGTIYTAVEAIERAGGRGLAVPTDIRDEQAVRAAVEKTVEAFGGIDILVNNASAIFLAKTVDVPMKRYDLMHQINARGTYLCSQACIPHLKKSNHAHILNISPPLNMHPRWFRDHCAYTMAKYGMSMCVLGMSAELAEFGIGVNALWPRTCIDTAALNLLGGEALRRQSRKAEIMGDAAHVVLTSDPKTCTGNFFIDDEVLAKAGVTDFERYAVDPTEKLLPDFFLD